MSEQQWGPLAVVVDANVLIRQVDYAVRKGFKPALIGHASPSYSTFTGVALIATSKVLEETVRHLPDIAARRAVPLDLVADVWNEVIRPCVRFVRMEGVDIADPRVSGTAALHRDDAPTAALACMVAPAILLTDNRRHFATFGLGAVKTDDVSIDLFAIGELTGKANAAIAMPQLAGLSVIQGVKALDARFGRDAAFCIVAIAAGALALLLTKTDRGRTLRESTRKVASELGPVIEEAMSKRVAAAERVSLLMVREAPERSALHLLAHELAAARPVLTTTEIAQLLEWNGFGFDGGTTGAVATRAWLASMGCFDEVRRGSWALGLPASLFRTGEGGVVVGRSAPR